MLGEFSKIRDLHRSSEINIVTFENGRERETKLATGPASGRTILKHENWALPLTRRDPFSLCLDAS